jgi:hypothetical protein
MVSLLQDKDDFSDWKRITNEIIGLVNGIGTLSSLSTTNKTNLVNAVNELVTKIGNLTSLTTTAKISLVLAVNEIVSRLDGLGIGVNVLRYIPVLDSFNALGNIASGNMFYTSGTNTVSISPVSLYGRNFVNSANYSEALTNLGASTYVQGFLGSNNYATGVSALGISSFFSGALDKDAVNGRAALGLAIGTNVQAFSANTLFSNKTANLVSGYRASSTNKSSISSGTFTPTVSDNQGNFQHITNNGAHTLGVPTNPGVFIIEYTNGATPGIITTSAYSAVDISDYNLAIGAVFQFFITKTQNAASLTVLKVS